jgi:hypothetical protein
VAAALAAPRVDLDRLATVPPLSDDGKAAAGAFPRDVRVSLDFTSDAVLAGGKAIHGLVLKGGLGDGAIAVSRFEGQLPGAGAFNVAGKAAVADDTAGGLRFTGTIDAHAANLRDLLAWLDVDAGAVPAGRLANAVLKAKVSVDGTHAELSDIDLHLDSTHASGTARIDYSDRSGVALDLAADHLDYDAYVNDAAPSATVPAPDPFAEMSGQGRLTFGRLTYRGIDFREVALTALLSNGDVTVAQFSATPPEAGEFMPVAPVATAAPVAVPLAAAAVTEDSSRAAAPAPESPAPARETEPDTSNTRDSFVRGILDFLSR